MLYFFVIVHRYPSSQIDKPDHSVLYFLFSRNALHQVPLLFHTPQPTIFFSCTASILQQVKKEVQRKRRKTKQKGSVLILKKSIEKREGVRIAIQLMQSVSPLILGAKFFPST